MSTAATMLVDKDTVWHSEHNKAARTRLTQAKIAQYLQYLQFSSVSEVSWFDLLLGHRRMNWTDTNIWWWTVCCSVCLVCLLQCYCAKCLWCVPLSPLRICTTLQLFRPSLFSVCQSCRCTCCWCLLNVNLQCASSPTQNSALRSKVFGWSHWQNNKRSKIKILLRRIRELVYYRVIYSRMH